MKEIRALVNEYWKGGLQLSIGICNLISYAIYPNSLFPEDSSKIKAIAQILTNCVLLLLIIPIKLYNKRKDLAKWQIISVLFFILVISSLKFQIDKDNLSIIYNKERIVIGTLSDMKPSASTQKKSLESHYGRPFSLADCIYYNAGKVDDFWEDDIIKRNIQILIGEF